ncbi:hypothetical protein ACHAXT_011925 [Thalassiosira profunda]
MGKLTGSSTPAPQSRANAGSDAPSIFGGSKEGEDAINSTLPSLPEVVGSDGGTETPEKPFDRPSHRPTGSAKPEFTNSMKRAVDSAAETARLVLDQGGEFEGGGDGRSVSSRGSVGLTTSIHSFDSRRRASCSSSGSLRLVMDGSLARSFDSRRRLSSSSVKSLGLELESLSRIGMGNETWQEFEGELDALIVGGTSLRFGKSDSSAEIGSDSTGAVPSSGPPPMAFQNLPMTGRKTPSRFIPSSHADASCDGSNNGLSNGKASGFVASHALGELQRKHYPAVSKRRSTSCADEHSARGDGELASFDAPMRRSHSGDAATMYLREMQKELEDASKARPRRSLPTQEEAMAEMLLNRTSFTSIDDLSFGSRSDGVNDLIREDKQLNGDVGTLFSAASYVVPTKSEEGLAKKEVGNKPGALPRRRSGSSLPTPEEAETEMLANRASYASDDSLESREDPILAMIESLKGEGKPSQTVESVDGSSSGFDNESNTSSVSRSEISPISTSIGGSSGGNEQGGAKGNAKGGMLGNLANSRKANMKETNIYDAGDSTQSENSGLVQDPAAKHRTPAMPATISKNPVPTPPSSESTPTTSHVSVAKAQHLDLQKQLSAAPAHRISLFDSFDRNWEQIAGRGSNADELLGVGRKCFASFVVVFGPCNTSTGGRSIFGGSAKNENGSDSEDHDTPVSWWVDEHAPTRSSEAMPAANEQPGTGGCGQDSAAQPGIPIAVVRAMWKACFFEDLDESEATGIIDGIERTLVNDLCYLSPMTTPSGVPCLRLSVDIYAEYGWYILRRFGMLDQIALWHARFATALRQILEDESATDASSMIQQRYAAQGLPKHTAAGLLDFDSESGHFSRSAATEEDRAELQKQLFTNLLCDTNFIKSRARLLGSGKTRPSKVDETFGVSSAQLAKLVMSTRDKDRNALFPTETHLKDIEWCASLCVLNSEGKNEREQHEKEEKMDDAGTASSLFSGCLDAMSKWKDDLVASFHSLRDSGKLTICDSNTAGVPRKGKRHKNEDPDGKNDTPLARHLARLNSQSMDTNDDTTSATGGTLMSMAKSLLAAEDAWTREDDSKEIFQRISSSSAEMASPVPPRKGWRKHHAGTKHGMAATAKTVANPLARVLSLDISDLRAAVSIGRSLIALAESLQGILEKISFEVKGRGDDSRRSLIHGLQLDCLKSAIEALSCSAVTLGYILSSSLDKLDDDDLDESISTSGPLQQLFALTREAAKPLLSVAGILSADAWFLVGKLVGDVGKLDSSISAHTSLFSFERALLVLNSPKTSSLNKPALDHLCESLLSPLTQSRSFLQSNINHSIGVYLYEQGDFDQASSYLNQSTRFWRQMLDTLRGQMESVDNRSEEVSKLYLAIVGGTRDNPFSGSCSMSEGTFRSVFHYSLDHGCLHLPRDANTAEELELGLSLTLEYSALTQHADQKYQQALSLFQESLILRTMHVGKSSLDVASLHFNMGVVYDDLEQYDQAISRYHESLRVRLDQMNKATSPSVVSELEDSVLLTLKCLGHVYKLVDDLDNAICCYIKALEMVNAKFSSYKEPADEWTKMGLRLGMASVPVPTVIFDEMKTTTGNASWKMHFQTMNKKQLCHVFDPKLKKRRSRSTVSKLKKQLTQLHSTVIDLVHLRKQNSWDGESGSSRVKSPGTSLLLASLSSAFKPGGDVFEAALMRSSFWMGRIRLEQMRYEEAADFLESALRSKWVLDPASSSDSDSDFSRRSISSRKKQQTRKLLDEDDPEEGQIYYALGLCNAALDDHERAVRCFLTAMRYLRRSLRKVDSLEVARVLFDCATSHYYLCNMEQAVSFYRECLRILDNSSVPSIGEMEEEMEEKPPSSEGDEAHVAAKRNALRRGVVLYCLVMAKAALGFDSEASEMLNEAQTLLYGCNDSVMLAYLEFLTGLFLYHAASQVPVRLRSITRITPAGLSLSEGMSWQEMCQNALTLFEQTKNECYFDPLEGVEDSEEVKHLPLSGHICLKKGEIYELLGSTDQALTCYVDAANFYRIACGDECMHVASVLHRMGVICSQRTEYHALGYFNEALSIRKNLLGNNDPLVAETLYGSAVVLARLNRYEASMERYHEALRCQMADCQDSSEVARTLAGMGVCHYSHGAYDLALTCLEGSIKIRKHRVVRLNDTADLVELYGEEVALGADFYNLGNVHMQMGDYSQAMQCLIQSRDLRWRHVGSGTIDTILDNFFSELTVDEDELLGLAHCLHNIGVMFDIREEYSRSLPHYEEALAIKNAVAGFTEKDSMSLVEQADPSDDSRALVLQSLGEDNDFPSINKATLSASVTRQKIATVYAKQRKYNHALFHFSHALRIQRHVLGKDHFRIGSILSSMGNSLRHLSSHSDTAVICYNESLRISKLRFGTNHATVASAFFDIGSLYDSNKNFGKAMHYYQRALSVYKVKYARNLRQRLCAGLDGPQVHIEVGEGGTELLSTGDEIVVAAPVPKLREQYARVTDALRNAKRQDMLKRGEKIGCVGDSNDAWVAFEVLLFRFVEMLSTYVVDPAQTMVRDAVDNSRKRIEAAAAQAVISAADAMDYQFLLLLQE